MGLAQGKQFPSETVSYVTGTVGECFKGCQQRSCDTLEAIAAKCLDRADKSQLKIVNEFNRRTHELNERYRKG